MRTGTPARLRKNDQPNGTAVPPRPDVSNIIGHASQMANELDDSDEELDSTATSALEKPSVSFAKAIEREFGLRTFAKPGDIELQTRKTDTNEKKKTNEDVNLLVCELINFNDPKARSFWSSQVMGKTFNAGTYLGRKDHYVEFPDSVASLMMPTPEEKDKKIMAHIVDTTLGKQNVDNGFSAVMFIDRVRKLALVPAEKKSIFACTNILFFQIPILRTKATHEFMVALSQIDVTDPNETHKRIMDWKTKYFVVEPKPTPKPTSTK